MHFEGVLRVERARCLIAPGVCIPAASVVSREFQTADGCARAGLTGNDLPERRFRSATRAMVGGLFPPGIDSRAGAALSPSAALAAQTRRRNKAIFAGGDGDCFATEKRSIPLSTRTRDGGDLHRRGLDQDF